MDGNVDRCDCGAWVYAGNQCGACYTFGTREQAKEAAMKRLIANMLREKHGIPAPLAVDQ